MSSHSFTGYIVLTHLSRLHRLTTLALVHAFAACLVSFADITLAKDNLVFFTGVEKAKFRKPVLPGCTLELNINILANKKSLYKFTANACVDDVTVATSEFSAMLVNQDKAS